MTEPAPLPYQCAIDEAKLLCKGNMECVAAVLAYAAYNSEQKLIAAGVKEPSGFDYTGRPNTIEAGG